MDQSCAFVEIVGIEVDQDLADTDEEAYPFVDDLGLVCHTDQSYALEDTVGNEEDDLVEIEKGEGVEVYLEGKVVFVEKGVVADLAIKCAPWPNADVAVARGMGLSRVGQVEE